MKSPAWLLDYKLIIRTTTGNLGNALDLILDTEGGSDPIEL